MAKEKEELKTKINELECALNAHTALVEKDKEGKWNELAKHVLDENRGAWEELGKEEKQ